MKKQDFNVITETELKELVQQWHDGKLEAREKYLAISDDNAKWIAVDNTEGDFYMEEFNLFENARYFLIEDEVEIEDLLIHDMQKLKYEEKREPLYCPNCGEEMVLEKVNVEDEEGNIVDIYGCNDCAHIQVKDIRETATKCSADIVFKTNREELGENIFNSQYEGSTKNLLKQLAKNAQEIYDEIEEDYEDTIDPSCLYQLGDAINFINYMAEILKEGE